MSLQRHSVLRQPTQSSAYMPSQPPPFQPPTHQTIGPQMQFRCLLTLASPWRQLWTLSFASLPPIVWTSTSSPSVLLMGQLQLRQSRPEVCRMVCQLLWLSPFSVMIAASLLNSIVFFRLLLVLFALFVMVYCVLSGTLKRLRPNCTKSLQVHDLLETPRCCAFFVFTSQCGC